MKIQIRWDKIWWLWRPKKSGLSVWIKSSLMTWKLIRLLIVSYYYYCTAITILYLYRAIALTFWWLGSWSNQWLLLRLNDAASILEKSLKLIRVVFVRYNKGLICSALCQVEFQRNFFHMQNKLLLCIFLDVFAV